MANPARYTKVYDYVSRYDGWYYYFDEKNNKYYYGLTAFLNNNNASGYAVYQVKPGDSYDSIALSHYGCALFYWIICDYNRIFDCFEPPEPGTILKLPPLNSIQYNGG